ncbi:MAG: hypothetical protein M0R06_10430 [Sphaerochaeta sp.]|jgi:hypothetical protein|nr:hypothetical protein [Sphaerochaeta sp.]
MVTYKVHVRSFTAPDGRLHEKQKEFVESTKKRIIVKAGRRGGKTVGLAIKALRAFKAGKRVLYAAPTINQVEAFWFEICRALQEPIDAGVLKKNESEHSIELPGTKQAIKAKTAWNADSLRGDYADLLILDEFQMMAENAWNDVGQPMLLDNNGDAVFLFTPPSLLSTGVSKANDPRHASKLFKLAQADTTGLWEAIHFTSHDNPFLPQEALGIIAAGMSLDSYRREIMAEDDDIEQKWLVYYMFNEQICKRSLSALPPNFKTFPIYSGHDFGEANPAAVFIARDPANGDLHVFKEYFPGPGVSPYQHVNAWKEILDKRTMAKSIGGNVTTEEDSRRLYREHGWNIQPPAWTRVKERVERVRAQMERNRIIIYDNCVRLLSEIANCMWKLSPIDNSILDEIKDEKNFHLLSALGYIVSDFTPETVSNSPSKVPHYTL